MPHPGGRVDPLDDAETVELELVFADQAAVERRRERVAKAAKGGDRDAVAEREPLGALMPLGWRTGRPARSAGVEVPEALDLLTAKPALYVANVDDTRQPDDVAALEAFAAERGSARARR